MPDNEKIRHPIDGKRIDVNDISELTDWCLELGTTEKQLKDAIKDLGTDSSSVIRKRFGK